jgi:hypothetical protein
VGEGGGGGGPARARDRTWPHARARTRRAAAAAFFAPLMDWRQFCKCTGGPSIFALFWLWLWLPAARTKDEGGHGLLPTHCAVMTPRWFASYFGFAKLLPGRGLSGRWRRSPARCNARTMRNDMPCPCCLCGSRRRRCAYLLTTKLLKGIVTVCGPECTA